MEKCKIRFLQALAALAVALGAPAGKAETGSKTWGGGVLDLAGADREVTTLAGYTGVVNTGARATLVVSNDVDETFSHVISGPVKLVKRGTGDLALGRENTFTGGTEIQRGRLVAANTGALGSGEVFVNSDCALPFTSANQANLSALTVACATFTNDIRLAAWSVPLAAYEGYRYANYNVQASLPGGTVDFRGAVTGGSLSFNNGQARAIDTPSAFVGTPTVNFHGPVALDGTVYVVDPDTVNFRERVACALLTGPNFWCRRVNLWPKGNEIQVVSLGADALVLNGADAIPGAVVSGTTDFRDTAHQDHDSINCGGCDQTIDRFVSTRDDWTCAETFPLRWFYHGSGKAPRVVMRATGDSRCDWRFENDVSLVWWPTDAASTMTCAADRASPTTGSIAVSNGTFAVTGATTFSNVTEIVVADGATFAMDGTAAGAFKSVTRVAVGAGATFRMGLVEAFTTADLTLDLAADATVVVPDGAAFDVGAILVDGDGLPVGTAYTGADGVDGATRIPQLSGTGRMSPLAAPPREKVPATWTGAAGTTDLETAANWSTADVAGQFQSGKVDATFASGGAVTVPTRDVLFHSLTFGGVTPFTLGAEGNTAEVGIGTGGLAASAETAEATVFAPVGIYGPQTWAVGAGHTLTVTGGLRQAAAKPTTVTKTGTGNVKLFGRGDAGTFAGGFTVSGALEAHGEDPFGRPAAGVDGTVRITGTASDYAVKFGNCRITKPVVVTGYCADGNGTGYFGVLSACTAEFAGPVDIASDVNFRLDMFKTKVVFSGGGTFAGRFQSYECDITITNKPLTVNFRDTPCGTTTVRFFVGGNAVNAFTPASYAHSVEFHADDAFAGNETEFLVKFHWGNGHYYGSTINLNGHSQRLGTLRSSVAQPMGATQSPFEVTPTGNSRITSDGPATLFVNQTADGVIIVPFMGQAALAKGGPATLVMSNTTHTATAPLAVTGGTLELFDASWPNATGVTVDATAGTDATLKLTAGPDARATIFPKKIPFTLVDGEGAVAKIEIPAGVQLRANDLVVNGRIRSGVWGSSASGAPNKDDVHFAGAGTVFGMGGGTVLILR